MDYQKLQKIYPLSIKKLSSWTSRNCEASVCFGESITDMVIVPSADIQLYDFFETQNLIITVSIYCNGKKYRFEIFDSINFHSPIFGHGEFGLQIKDTAELEKNVFEKAFLHLEGVLIAS